MASYRAATALLRIPARQRNPTPTNGRFPAVNMRPMRGQVGKHMVHQMRRRLCHVPRAARRAKATALAAEGQQLVVAAVAAAQPQEAVRQDAAFQEGVELVTDELRQPGTCGLFGLNRRRGPRASHGSRRCPPVRPRLPLRAPARWAADRAAHPRSPRDRYDTDRWRASGSARRRGPAAVTRPLRSNAVCPSCAERLPGISATPCALTSRT